MHLASLSMKVLWSTAYAIFARSPRAISQNNLLLKMHSGKNFSAVHFLFWCRQASDHRFRTGNAEKTPILAVNTVYRKSVYFLLLRFHRERISRTFPLAVFGIKFFILLDFPIFPKLFYINRRQNASSSRSTFGTKNAPIFHTPAAKG